MGLELSQYFRGREKWRTINQLIIWVIMVSMIPLIQMIRYNPIIVLTIFGVLAVILLIYNNIYQRSLINVLNSRIGIRTVEGWITHGFKRGEEMYFRVKKFEVKEKLSKNDLEDVQKFVNKQVEHNKALNNKTGMELFRRKQLTYDDVTKKTQKDTVDKLKFEKEEKEEVAGWEDEYEKMKQEKSKITEDNNDKK